MLSPGSTEKDTEGAELEGTSKYVHFHYATQITVVVSRQTGNSMWFVYFSILFHVSMLQFLSKWSLCEVWEDGVMHEPLRLSVHNYGYSFEYIELQH